MKKFKKNKMHVDPIWDFTHYDHIKDKDNTVSEELHNYTVVDANGTTHHVQAARMSFYGGAVNFWGPKSDKREFGEFLSTFNNPIAAEEDTPHALEVPRIGREYYSVDEVKRALSETYGGGSANNSDYMFGKVKVHLKGGHERYTLAEWRNAALNSEHYSSGEWYAKQIERAITQVRKNRAYNKHGDS